MKLSPFMKWAGGKRQLMNDLLDLCPKTFNDYYEPFVGGGALLLELQPSTAYINDFNEELVSIYMCLNDEVLFNQMFELCKEYENKHSKEFYFALRNADRAEGFSNIEIYKKASRCLYLNKACFNGLYRVNSKGYFNVPFNGKERLRCFDDENIKAIHSYFMKIKPSISCGDFEKCIETAKQGDFVYFDPPYDFVSEQSFVSYTKNGFGRKEQERLANVFRRLSNKGVYVMLSNSNTSFIRDLYKDFNIHIVYAKRMINSKADGRGNVEEVIVTNY